MGKESYYILTEQFPPSRLELSQEKIEWRKSHDWPSHLPRPHDVLAEALAQYNPDGTVNTFSSDTRKWYTKKMDEPIDISHLNSDEITRIRDELAQQIYRFCTNNVSTLEESMPYQKYLLAKELSPYREQEQLLREAAQVSTELIELGLPGL